MAGVYERQVRRVLSRGIGSDPSLNPLWRRYTDKLSQAVRDGAETVDPSLFSVMHSRFARIAAGEHNPLPADLNAALQSSSNVPYEHREHLGALVFLHQRGALQGYLADMDRLGLRSDLQAARTWWYVRTLAPYVERPGVMLEIGPGCGLFALLAIDAGLASQFVMVDLPEMIANAIAHLEPFAPGWDRRLGEAPQPQAGPTLWFLNPDEIGLVGDKTIDVALNFNSFSEMDEEVRDGYLAEVYRTARPGALFYHVNRRHRAIPRRDGTDFENNPLLYPYAAGDRILAFETDDFQQSTRAWQFISPHASFCMSRIARLA
jgi:hypothetical protein